MFKWLVFPLVLISVGCRSYRPSAPLPAPATDVRVTFAYPRDVVVTKPSGESAILRSITELRGSIVRAALDTRRDSMRVRLGTASDRSGRLGEAEAGSIAIVAVDPTVRVEEKSLDGPKTAGLVIVVVLGVLAIGFIALLRAYEFPS